MRKLGCVALLAIVSFGCQPRVLFLNAQPSSAGAGPANVTLNWKISVGGGEMSADQTVSPSLNPPRKVSVDGSMVEQICTTTTFKLALPYGGERTVTVPVTKPCTCSEQVLIFTGNCPSASQGPSYSPQTVSDNVVGNLKDLQNDADFPIHVLHAGADIALNAGGGPIFPLPVVPAAGDYTIIVPGQAGLKVCAGAPGPTGGDPVNVPVIHLTVVPVCLP